MIKIDKFIAIATILILLISVPVKVYALDHSTYKMDNGQILIIKEIHDNPVVTINTFVKTGSVNETDKNSGISHLLEHMLFKGTKNYPIETFNKELDINGANINAYTSFDYTSYSITLPSKNLKKAMDIQVDMLFNSLLREDDIEIEKNVILKEPNNNKLEDIITKLFYLNNPHKASIIGTSESLKNISQKELYSYYKTWYTPSNMVTVVVGDIDTKEVLKLAKNSFIQSSSNCSISKKSEISETLKKQSEFITYKKDLPLGMSYLCFETGGINSKKDIPALNVLYYMLGVGESSKLVKSVKKTQLAYDIFLTSHRSKENSALIIESIFEPSNMEKVKKSIMYEIKKIQDGNFTESDIQKAKDKIIINRIYARETTDKIAEEIGYTTLIFDDSQYYNDYLENIQKVTRNDIINVAKKYLNCNQAIISTTLPQEFHHKKSQQTSVLPEKPTIVKKQDTITQYKFQSGINLIINKNKANDVIAIKIFSPQKNYSERQSCIALLTTSYMMKGTALYSERDLQELMEEKGIVIEPNFDKDVFSISIKTTKKDLPLALDILNEIINNASFDKNKLSETKKEILTIIQAYSNSPEFIAIDELRQKLFQGTSLGLSGKETKRILPTITYNEITQYFNNLFQPNKLVISVSGDVLDEEICNYMIKIFSSRTSQVSNINKQDHKEIQKQVKSIKTIKKETKKNIASILIAWPIYNLKEPQDIQTLNVIDFILGKGISSRLFEQLRNNQCLAYNISSHIFKDGINCVFYVYAETTPALAQKTKNELLQQINLLKNDTVQEVELDQVKEKLLSRLILEQETNMGKANILGSINTNESNYKSVEDLTYYIKSVTPKDIERIANKYFNQPYGLVIIAPKECLKHFK